MQHLKIWNRERSDRVQQHMPYRPVVIFEVGKITDENHCFGQ